MSNSGMFEEEHEQENETKHYFERGKAKERERERERDCWPVFCIEFTVPTVGLIFLPGGHVFDPMT